MSDAIVNLNVAGQISNEVLAIGQKVRPFAASMAQADKTYDGIIEVTAREVAKLLGTEDKVTFVLWNQVSYEFRSTYMNTRGCASKTADNRWSDIVSYMEKNFELKKPQAPTVAADKKAKERAAIEKKVKAAKAQYVKPAEAFQAAQELIAQGKVNEAKIVQTAAVALAKDMADDVKKQNGDKLKKLRDDMKAALAKCDDISTLQAALDVLKKGADPKPAKPAAKKVSGKKAPVLSIDQIV